MDFDDARADKWARGRAERGLEDIDGFMGDPAQELAEEMLDVANYADELRFQGRITEEEQTRAHSLAFEFYQWARQIDR